MGKVKLFSEESKRWILENHCSAETVKCFTARYNREFNECRSKGTMKHYLRKLGLKQDDRKFSKEEDSWLLAHAPSLSVDETAKQFNAFFRENRSAQVLKARCNRFLNIKHKHDRSGRAMSVGSEITNTNGFVFVKVDNKKSAGFYQNWKQKHQIVWEQHNGKIPAGHKVIFLDRNRSNCSIENLYIVDGKVMREMSKKKWFSDIPEITLTAIKWCEMFCAIKQVDAQS